MDFHPLSDYIPTETSTDWIFELAQLPERMNISSYNPPLYEPSLPRIENVNNLLHKFDGVTNQWDIDCLYTALEPPNVAVRVYDQDNNVYGRPTLENNQFPAQSTLHHTAVSGNGSTYEAPVSTPASVVENKTCRNDLFNGTPAFVAGPTSHVCQSLVSSEFEPDINVDDAANSYSSCRLIHGASAATPASVVENEACRNDLFNGAPAVSVKFAVVDRATLEPGNHLIYGAPAATPASVVENETCRNDLFNGAPAVPVKFPVVDRATREGQTSRSTVSSALDPDSTVNSCSHFMYGTTVDTPASVVENETCRNDLFNGTPAVPVRSALANETTQEPYSHFIYGAPVDIGASVVDGQPYAPVGGITERHLHNQSSLTSSVNDGAPTTLAASVFVSHVESASVSVMNFSATASSSTIAKKRKPKQKKAVKIKLALDKKHKKYAVKVPCKCKKNCQQKVSFDRQNEINKHFWDLDYVSQKLYIRSKTTKPSLPAAARNLVKYFLTTANDQTVEVCQIFFLATLGFKPNNNTVVRDALKNEFPRPDGRGKNLNKWKFDEAIVIDHIMSFHPETSHYRREHAPLRKYLPSDITITKMHQLFTEKESNMSCSYDYYRKIVDKLNISFTKLGHEKCEKCEFYAQHSHTSPDCQQCTEYDQHKEFYTLARIQYNADKLLSDDPQNVIVSVDMQKVIMLPRMEQFKEALFTKRICVFNETFAPIGGSSTLPVFASVWHEGIAGRKKEELISSFRSFILYHRNAATITFWSDNCTAQNKCWALFCFMVYIVNSDEIAATSITMKFLEKGHTFMSADSFHHQVELAIKHSEKGSVYDFNDFVKCVQSSNGQRVVCKELNFSDFADWPDWTSTSKLNKATPRPYISNISKIKFVRGKKTMLYANSFEDDWTELDFIMAKHQGLVPPDMRDTAAGISREVKEGVTRKLAPLMPQNRRTFWYDLATKDH